MKAHVVKDNVVTNTILVENLDGSDNLIDGSTGGIGWIYDGKNLTAPSEDSSGKENSLRKQRNALLAASDWTQGNDSPLSNDKKIEWATYRTALRNLPTSEGWPNLEDADWPTKPS